MKKIESLRKVNSQYNGGFKCLTLDQSRKIKGGRLSETRSTNPPQCYNTQCALNCGCSNNSIV